MSSLICANFTATLAIVSCRAVLSFKRKLSINDSGHDQEQALKLSYLIRNLIINENVLAYPMLNKLCFFVLKPEVVQR